MDRQLAVLHLLLWGLALLPHLRARLGPGAAGAGVPPVPSPVVPLVPRAAVPAAGRAARQRPPVQAEPGAVELGHGGLHLVVVAPGARDRLEPAGARGSSRPASAGWCSRRRTATRCCTCSSCPPRAGWCSSIAERLSWRAAVLLGGVMGLGALTRAEHLHLWPFLLVYAWLHRERQAPVARAVVRWAGAVGVSLVVLAPWTLHNARVLQEINARTPGLEPLPVLAPVTVYGPINFAMANHAGATGGFTPDLVNRLGQDGRPGCGQSLPAPPAAARLHGGPAVDGRAPRGCGPSAGRQAGTLAGRPEPRVWRLQPALEGSRGPARQWMSSSRRAPG